MANAHAVTTKDLDALDRRIIDQLQEDGRRSNVAIARVLGVTETTIRHRIDRLISHGFIRIAAVIDPRKTPYLTDAMIWIRLERGKAREAGEHLAALPNVVLTPHIGGGTLEAQAATQAMVLANLAAFFAGAPLPTPVPGSGFADAQLGP